MLSDRREPLYLEEMCEPGAGLHSQQQLLHFRSGRTAVMSRHESRIAWGWSEEILTARSRASPLQTT
ncbi:UNVERIFIED_CONTAM: hypothetical protein FKN15_006390 [Acipenser sinensis]